MANYAYEPINTSNDPPPSESSNCCQEKKTKFLVAVLVTASLLTIILVSILHHNSKSEFKYLYSDVVNTDCGKIIGLKEYHDGKASFVFKGIPYAKPPVGDLRWKPSQALNKSKGSCWKGTYKAIHFSSQCVQGGSRGISGNEDCLYLNVWTPSLDDSKNLPVFVWIHGGYLLTGNGNTIGYAPSAEFVTSMNVVAVSMNYRLNAFGFLTLKELWDEGKSYGNYGIMDQILVLKWIQSNIKSFGGDPNSVTVSGQSSGGTSIFGLLSAPIADGLFHKVIPMSGSPKFTIDYKQASEDNKIFINSSKCHLVEKTQIKNCLYSLTSFEVFRAIPFYKYPNWAMADLLDFPKKGLFDGALIVVDQIIVKTSPQNISQTSFKTNVSILTGVTAQEAAFDQVRHFQDYSSFKTFFTSRLTEFSNAFPAIVLDDLYNTTEFKNKELDYLFTTIVTDVRAACPTNLLTKAFANSPSHQAYQYIVVNSPLNPIKIPVVKAPLKYAFHMWDSQALFNFEMFKQYGFEPNENDIKFKDVYRNVVKEFMVTGNLKKFNWNSTQTGLFTLNSTISVLSDDYHKWQCDFWNDEKNGFRPYAWIN